MLVHPTDLPGIDLMDKKQYDPSRSVGFMADTTPAFTRMIVDGFLDLYPNLKLVASHGGGTLPYLVGRFEKGDEVEIPSRRRMKRRPTGSLKSIWYDCIIYDPRSLEFLISIAARHCSLEVMFEPGDIQLLNNHVCLHSCTAFQDYEEEDRKRHPLRMWMSVPNSRALSPVLGTIFQDQRGGAERVGFPFRTGQYLSGTQHTPID